MSLDRINRIEQVMKLRKEMNPGIPDFASWSEGDLDKYILTNTEEFHKENAIKNYDDAKNIYDTYLERELISKEEYDIFIQIEKRYWKVA